MRRRDFLACSAAACTASQSRLFGGESPSGRVVTVTGLVDAKDLGTTLPHEHVMVDFVGADRVSRQRYDREQVFDVVLPHLKDAKRAGCQTLVECTPEYLGRDPVLLKQLSEACGLFLLTNTGYYGARNAKFLPAHAHTETDKQLADRWLSEWRDGIGDSGVRPGFIKIGVDRGPLTEVNQKLVRAAAKTHLQSGLAIACHTGDGAAAMQEMSILREHGVDASAWIWVHAQNEKDTSLHRRVAEQGGWVEFDGIRPDSIEQHLELVQNMKRSGLLSRTLISHDAGWYSVGEPRGGQFRSFTTLLESFIPRLREAGFNNEDIRLLTAENPARALAIRE